MSARTVQGLQETRETPALPEGWRAEVDTDGVLRLAEAVGRRTVRGAGVLCLSVAWNAAIWPQAHSLHSALSGGAPWLRLLALAAHVLFGIGLAAWAVWLLFGREEWRVRPGLLIVRRWGCGWRWERRFVAGRYRLISDADGNSHLLIQPPGGTPTVLLRATPADAAQLERFRAFLAVPNHWVLREQGPRGRVICTEVASRKEDANGMNGICGNVDRGSGDRSGRGACDETDPGGSCCQD